MSDYVKNKVIRRRVTKDFYNKHDTYDSRLPDPFEIEITIDYNNKDYESEFFLDKVLYHSYGRHSGDYGFVRKVTEAEIQEHLDSFNELLPTTSEDLKYVEYCHYNCCECQTYFDEEGLFDNDDEGR